MTLQQIITLENKLSSDLRENIDAELRPKLGLSLSHEMSGFISYCALLACWILLFKKAENSFQKQLKQFRESKSIHFNSFQQIISGKLDSVTVNNIESIILYIDENFIKKTKVKYKKLIEDDIKKVEKKFDTINIYNYLDDLFLSLKYKGDSS